MAAASTQPAAQSPTLAVLVQEGEKAIAKDQFASAKIFFATALNPPSIHGDKGGPSRTTRISFSVSCSQLTRQSNPTTSGL